MESPGEINVSLPQRIAIGMFRHKQATTDLFRVVFTISSTD